MSRPVTAVWATFVKDWKLLWPVVVLNGALLAAGALLAGEVRQLASTLSLVAGALLIVAVVHLDAPASPRADWLTRPIAPATLLAGKLSFLVITMLVPAIASEWLWGLHEGRSLTEILATTSTDFLIGAPLAIGLMAIAALTRTLVEAGMLALMVALFGVVVVPLSLTLAGLPPDVVPNGGFGPLVAKLAAAGAIGGALVLYLQYVPRRSRAACVALVATLLALAVIQIVFAFSLPRH